ncbi:MAG: hypothetical protein RBT33_00885 [Candidatus Dojkabacteria bacterium]|jgi:hypothetical protein|nr:hypothetical protein [Candidatus Dojkabacteria bacterium]MDX9738908.1 hypothetical protein [Candidatus Dojkabacteria bacterium]
MTIEQLEELLRKEILHTFPDLESETNSWFGLVCTGHYKDKQVTFIPEGKYTKLLAFKGVDLLASTWVFNATTWGECFLEALKGIKLIHGKCHE